MDFGGQLAAKAAHEYATYSGIKETREPLKSRIREYYRAVGANFDGGDTSIAWSAAFVSKMVELAGAADHFPYNILHAVYINRVIGNEIYGIGIFRGLRATGTPLRLGDIVASNRLGSPLITYEFAAANDDFFSHCDIVTRIVSGQEVVVTGGNVGDKVGRTVFRQAGGIWKDSRDSRHQLFCAIRAVAWVGDTAP